MTQPPGMCPDIWSIKICGRAFNFRQNLLSLGSARFSVVNIRSKRSSCELNNLFAGKNKKNNQILYIDAKCQFYLYDHRVDLGVLISKVRH